jgi:phosphatidylserine decarboxylase
VALTKYGSDVMITVVIIAAVLIGLALWTDVWWLQALLLAISAFLIVFSLNFFRDPERTADLKGRSGDDLVICPADGKVVVIKPTTENEYLKGPAQQISIFMSPMDVHVNRSPMTGKVEYFRYVKGEFLVAHSDESTHRNERAVIGLNSGGRKILFMQVAGYIARRIVCPVKVGDALEAGKRFGMIKFGSRVDIFLPINADIMVKIGETVKAGHTVIAELTTPESAA